MDLSGLPQNTKHKLCTFYRSPNLDELATPKLTQQLVLIFAVNKEENLLCELFITRTYIKSCRYESRPESEMKTFSLWSALFYAIQLKAHYKQLDPYLVYSPSNLSPFFPLYIFFIYIFYWYTHKEDLANSVCRKRRRKNFISLFCYAV